jgi:hypothetical protein
MTEIPERQDHALSRIAARGLGLGHNMNMFPNIHPFVGSLWLITAELYSKQLEALRLNG